MKKRVATRRKRKENNPQKNVTEDVIYDKMFITKTLNQNHGSEKFISDSGATLHMVNSEGNLTNLKGAKI